MKTLREMMDIIEGFSSNDLSDGPYKEGFIQGRKTNDECKPPYPTNSNESDLYKRGFYYGRKIKRDQEESLSETEDPIQKIEELFRDKR